MSFDRTVTSASPRRCALHSWPSKGHGTSSPSSVQWHHASYTHTVWWSVHDGILMACRDSICVHLITCHHTHTHTHVWSSGMSEEMDLTIRALEQLLPRFFKGDYAVLWYAMLCYRWPPTNASSRLLHLIVLRLTHIPSVRDAFVTLWLWMHVPIYHHRIDCCCSCSYLLCYMQQVLTRNIWRWQVT